MLCVTVLTNVWKTNLSWIHVEYIVTTLYHHLLYVPYLMSVSVFPLTVSKGKAYSVTWVFSSKYQVQYGEDGVQRWKKTSVPVDVKHTWKAQSKLWTWKQCQACCEILWNHCFFLWVFILTVTTDWIRDVCSTQHHFKAVIFPNDVSSKSHWHWHGTLPYRHHDFVSFQGLNHTMYHFHCSAGKYGQKLTHFLLRERCSLNDTVMWLTGASPAP